jgi:hypothetical protein
VLHDIAIPSVFVHSRDDALLDRLPALRMIVANSTGVARHRRQQRT